MCQSYFQLIFKVEPMSVSEYKNITMTILNTEIVEVGLYSVLKRDWLWTGRLMARMYFTS